MKTEEFLNLLEDPKGVQKIGVDELRELALAYPYSQVIQLLYGIRLRYSSEHLFNQQLGKAAALSNDRSVLFELFEDKPKVKAGANTLQKNDIVELERVEQKSIIRKEDEKILPEKPIVKKAESATSVDDHSKSSAEKTAETPLSTAAKMIPGPSAPVPPPPAPKKKIEFMDAKPEGLENLSPQERVKAILERNRQLRQQFEDQRNAASGEEKLFSAPGESSKVEVPEEEKTPTADKETEPIAFTEPNADIQEEPKLEAKTEELEPEMEGAIADEAPEEVPDEDSAEVARPKNELKSEAEEKTSEDTKEERPRITEDTSFAREEERDKSSRNEDLPIDISDLIRRRYRSRFEVKREEESPEVKNEEPEITSVADQKIELEETSTKKPSSESEIIEEVKSTIDSLEKNEAAGSGEEQSDLGMSVRIRGIRARLERLKQEEALSEEEMEALLEEHQKLEELLNFLPADNEHVFEVELAAEKEEAEAEKEEIEDAHKSDSEVEDVSLHVSSESKKEIPGPIEQVSEEADSSSEPSSESDAEPEKEEEQSSFAVDAPEKLEAAEEAVYAPEIEHEEAFRKDEGSSEKESHSDTEESTEKLAEESINEKPKVEPPKEIAVAAPSNESEEEPDLEDEISRIEALAERLRYERQGVKLPEQQTFPAAEKAPVKLDVPQAEAKIEETVNKKSESENSSDEKEDLLQEQDLQQEQEEFQKPGQEEVIQQELEQEQEEIQQPSQEEEEIVEQEQELKQEQQEKEGPQQELEQEQEREEVQQPGQEEVIRQELEQEQEEVQQQEQEQVVEQEQEVKSPSFGDLLRRLNRPGDDSVKKAELNTSEEKKEENTEKPVLKSEIAEKIDLIDAFVEKLPDLKKRKPSKAEIINAPEVKKAVDPAEEVTLVTETLAKVYIKQGHFKKAIQAYEILRLKYPEKSSFFASRILEIKELSNSKK